MQEQGDVGRVGTSPPNPDGNDLPATVQQGHTIPTQLVQLPLREKIRYSE